LNRSTIRHAWLLALAACAAAALVPRAAHAQAAGVAGVKVDPSGTLRVRTVDTRGKLVRPTLKEADADLVHISLPRLFAEVRKRLEAGAPLGDELRTLRGMVKIEKVYVYPDEKDLVIAGRAEPVDVRLPMPPGDTVSFRVPGYPEARFHFARIGHKVIARVEIERLSDA